MSGTKQWPELVGKTFEQASQAILSFNSGKDLDYIILLLFFSLQILILTMQQMVWKIECMIRNVLYALQMIMVL